ncbi:ABC transporter permease [Arundinibacter roseus]|uniref:FtsX-like permease family protein n=1 Tax=Arundinibacter roseus TaxID=2070510 RepID=A0A4R4KDJ5_9BACT|nr:ABC transporter permease [Arundinibacter roseus]TDB65918.1 FtsX-like permease family protein [Arundinibacter roseus]
MIKNYLKIAWRNLLRNKIFSAINTIGLSIGLATCLLIGLYVADELAYDRFHEKAGQIVRVYFKGTMNGGNILDAHVMPPTAHTLQREYPEVLQSTRLRQAGSPVVQRGNDSFKANAVAFVDSNFFQIFSFPLQKGNLTTALVRPYTAIISAEMARRHFGNTDAIGQTFRLKGDTEVFEITGVLAPLPTQTQFRFDFYLSMAGLAEARENSWMESEFFTYLVLPENYDYQKLEAKLPQVVEKYMAPQLEQAFGMSLTQFRQRGNDVALYLQPLTDVHLHSDFAYDVGTSGDIRYVYLFGAIAVFMLLIACINFMNLSTAGASKRAREVGVRKVMGSDKSALVTQFLLESILLTTLALAVAAGLVLAALPFFNDFSHKNLTLASLSSPWLLPGLLLFGLLVGILAGSYPAFFLSSFQPMHVLKGGSSSGGGARGLGLRSGLVVVQFCISFVLIVGTTVVYQQLEFIQNTKLGYEKEQVMVVQETWRLGQKEQAFRRQLMQDARVLAASVSGFLPAGPSSNNNFLIYGDDNSTQFVKTLRYDVDEQYIPTLGMQMAAGRNFSPEYGTDSSGIILNQTAATAFGWGADAVGHTITWPDNQGRKKSYQVIGVVEDFHFKSLHERISPLVMTLGQNSGQVILKVKTEDLPGLIATIDQVWKTFAVDTPLDYSFLEENFNAVYQAEQQTGRILGFFSGLTILVACLGLFGLATFTAELRTKEIGVRKVLGASVAGIVALLSFDFLKLVGLAILLASPVAWYLMHTWLSDFVYRVDLHWGVFAVAGLLSVSIALLTVSYQSIRAALMNPVKSLRSE